MPSEWADVCEFLKPRDSHEKWKVRLHGACSVPNGSLGHREKDQSCHHEVRMHLALANPCWEFFFFFFSRRRVERSGCHGEITKVSQQWDETQIYRHWRFKHQFLGGLDEKQNIQREGLFRMRDARVRSGYPHFDLQGMSVHNDRKKVLLSFPTWTSR